MDPKEARALILNTIAVLRKEALRTPSQQRPAYGQPWWEDMALQLCDAVEDLEGWMACGGTLPSAWKLPPREPLPSCRRCGLTTKE